MYFDTFPANSQEIYFPINPVQSVSYLKWIDWNGVEQTVDASSYVVDNKGINGRLALKANLVWPLWPVWPNQQPVPNSVFARFVAGYGNAATVPEPIKHALRIMVAHYYENRQIASPAQLNEVPQTAEYLLYPFRSIPL